MSVRKSLVQVGIAQAGMVVVQLISTIVLARLLTPYEFGVHGVALSAVAIITIFQAFGFVSYVIRETELTSEKLGSVATLQVLQSLILGVLIVALSGPIGDFVNDQTVTTALRILALAPLFFIFEFAGLAMLQRNIRFGPVVAINLFKSALTTIIAIILASNHVGALSLPISYVVGAVIGSLLTRYISREFYDFDYNLKHWRSIMRFGAYTMTTTGVNALNTRMPDVILGRVADLTAVGLYGRAVSMIDLVRVNLVEVLGRVLFPALADAHRRGHGLASPYTRIVTVLTGALWPAFGGLAILATPLTVLMYGEPWMRAGYLLSCFAIAAMIELMTVQGWELFIIKDRMRLQAALVTINTSLSLLLFTLSAFVSLERAAESRILAALIGLLILLPSVRHLAKVKIRDLALAYLRSAGLLLCATAPALITMTAMGWPKQPSLLLFAASVVPGVILWAIGVWVFGGALRAEIQRVFGDVFAKLRPAQPR
jgi:O-antigen/teichoic acid export membrane protein